jgi:hypothetical protein
MHRVTFRMKVELTASIDINDDVARMLKMRPGEIDQFLANRHEVIFAAAKEAAGRKIEELMRDYTEEFTAGGDPHPLPPLPQDRE